MGAVVDALVKDEFRNTSQGYAGAIIIDPDGRRRGIAVPPGETVFLSEDEQILTANAPKREENNPFANGTFELVTEASEIRNRRTIGNMRGPQAPLAATPQAVMGVSQEETGSAPEPEAEAPEGENAPNEEVATPEARRAPAQPPTPQGQEAMTVPAPPARDPQPTPTRKPPKKG